eukprot:5580611-Pyramimonas_sp.AAC.1
MQSACMWQLGGIALQNPAARSTRGCPRAATRGATRGHGEMQSRGALILSAAWVSSCATRSRLTAARRASTWLNPGLPPPAATQATVRDLGVGRG